MTAIPELDGRELDAFYDDVDANDRVRPNTQRLRVIATPDVTAFLVVGKMGSVKGALWVSREDAVLIANQILAVADGVTA